MSGTVWDVSGAPAQAVVRRQARKVKPSGLDDPAHLIPNVMAGTRRGH